MDSKYTFSYRKYILKVEDFFNPVSNFVMKVFIDSGGVWKLSSTYIRSVVTRPGSL